MKYDFCGWATKNNMKCSDGRVIRKDAFAVNDGKKVPLVWNHHHETTDGIIGHAILQNKTDGVYAYCSLNNTQAGKNAREIIMHGDVESLSIWANNLCETGHDVNSGVIREVSLVIAGANPGAFIESVVSHGEPMGDFEDEAIIYTGEDILIHGSEIDLDGSIMHAQTSTSKDADNDDPEEETLGDVYSTLTDKQKVAVAIIVGQAVSNKNENKEGDDMAHSIFDQKKENDTGGYLSHADSMAIIDTAKRTGSLKHAYNDYISSEGIIEHAAGGSNIPTTGMNVPQSSSKPATYGIEGIESLYPDYRNVNTTPEIISRDMVWVAEVLSGVSRNPFEKIKTQFADITADAARAKGYIKGTQKYEEVFSLLNRTTDAQTVYKLQKLDRDDVLAITDFEVIAFLRREMEIMLNEEIAKGILIGDGRLTTDKFKIKEDRIRPVATDVDLFNIKIHVNAPANTQMSVLAKKTIRSIIKKRKKYRGSGDPVFFVTEDALSEMLLLEDNNGRALYDTMEKLATALRVRKIVTVEPMTGVKISGEELVGVIVNLADYKVGQNPKSRRNMFDDFDLDFNKLEYLLEERMSGTLVKPFSALTITLMNGNTFSDEGGEDDGSEEGTV